MESYNLSNFGRPERVVDNSYDLFNPLDEETKIGPDKIDIKDAKKCFESCSNPCTTRIKEFKFPDSWTDFGAATSRKSLSITPLYFVKNLEELKDLCGRIEKETEIAVDLEHHSKESYQGYICLIQISGRTWDAIIDPFSIWQHIPLLRNVRYEGNKKVFLDEKKVKVFHGAFNDVVWLQRDFGIYIVNLFDTAKVVC